MARVRRASVNTTAFDFTCAQTRHDGFATQRRVKPFVERLEHDEYVAVVRAVGIQDERRPRYGHRVGNTGRLQGDFFDRRGHLDRAFL